MTPLMRKLIIWAIIIFIIGYVFNLNYPNILTDIIHAAQTAHNSHH